MHGSVSMHCRASGMRGCVPDRGSSGDRVQKSRSDGAADLRHVGDWTDYLHVIDEKLAAAIGLLEQAIGGGLLGG